jgi:hypothetical protein
MRGTGAFLLLALAGAVGVCAYWWPSLLAENEFLKNFINHEILNILAVIMTISLATIATIHIWFNELEQKHHKRVFGKARRELNQAAFLLIWLFLIALVLLIVRSMFDKNDHMVVSLFNGGALLLLLGNVITLLDVMGVVRALTPED